MGACACASKKKRILSNSFKISAISSKENKKNNFYSITESSWMIILDFLKYKDLIQAGKLNRSFYSIARSIPVLTKFFKNTKIGHHQSTLTIGEIRYTHLMTSSELNSEFLYSRKMNGDRTADGSYEYPERQGVIPNSSEILSLKTISIQKPKESNLTESSLVAPMPKQVMSIAVSSDNINCQKTTCVFNVNHHQQSTAVTFPTLKKNTICESIHSDFIQSNKGIESSSDNHTPSFREKDISSIGDGNNHRGSNKPICITMHGVFRSSSSRDKENSPQNGEYVVCNFGTLSEEYQRLQKTSKCEIVRANTDNVTATTTANASLTATVENLSQKKAVLIMSQ